jgi:hypothetical protein
MAGNATVTLYNGKGTTTFDVWLQTFSTGSQNEFTTQQVRDKLSRIPIRRAQMFLQFTIAWPVITNRKNNGKLIKPDAGFAGIDPADGFAKMQKFQDTLWIHQQSIVNGSTALPMVVNYHNNSDQASPNFNTLISTKPLKPLTYQGWVQTVEKQYVRFQNVYVTSYQMNILTSNTNKLPISTMLDGRSITYAPTAADQKSYGVDGWVDIDKAVQKSNSIKIIPQ